MDSQLETPEFLEWVKCYEAAVEVVAKFFREGGFDVVKADKAARAIFARLASADIVVDWNKDDTKIEEDE